MSRLRGAVALVGGAVVFLGSCSDDEGYCSDPSTALARFGGNYSCGDGPPDRLQLVVSRSNATVRMLRCDGGALVEQLWRIGAIDHTALRAHPSLVRLAHATCGNPTFDVALRWESTMRSGMPVADRHDAPAVLRLSGTDYLHLAETAASSRICYPTVTLPPLCP